jgi:peptidoglycan/LPS O-acetylase OafA/YrhL
MEWSILAALRFFLAWMVLCSHLRWFLPDNELILNFGKPDAIAAVISFLVISGYSIASSLSRSTKGFYKRRIFRLYPIYFTSIFFTFVPFLLTKSNSVKGFNRDFIAPDIILVPGNLFFLQNFFTRALQSNGVIWTLSLEVFFYLVAPFISKKVDDRKLLLFIVLSVICFIFHSYAKLPHFPLIQGGLNVLFLGWAWCLGFYFYRNKNLQSSRYLLIGLGTVALGLYGSPMRIITYLITCSILILSPKIKLPKLVEIIFDFAGNISYPLYLVHVPSLIIAYSILGYRHWFYLVIFSLAVSTFFYYVLDFYSKNRKKFAST